MWILFYIWSTELVSLYVGVWILNTYYYCYYYMLYADDLCIISLSSVVSSKCCQFVINTVYFITFNVNKSVSMFFRWSMNKTCDITNAVLSGNIIDYGHKTKYLGVLLCSDIKISIDVCRQTSKFYPQANTLLPNLLLRRCKMYVSLSVLHQYLLFPILVLTSHHLV